MKKATDQNAFIASHRKELESCHHSREIQQVVDNEVAKERQKLEVTIDECKNK